MLNLLHNVSGFILIIAFVTKIVSHYLLDFLHQRNLEMMSLITMPIYYLKRYTSEVDLSYTTLKAVCNFSLLMTISSLGLNFVVGLLILYRNC